MSVILEWKIGLLEVLSPSSFNECRFMKLETDALVVSTKSLSESFVESPCPFFAKENSGRLVVE